MKFTWGRRADAAVSGDAVISRAQSGPTFSVSDPAMAEFLGAWGQTDAGVNVNERTAMAVTAVYRSVATLADLVSSLPLKSYRTDPATGTRVPVSSFLDDPGAGFYTTAEFKSLVTVHMALHGEAFLLHLYGGAGQLIGLFPIHPLLISSVCWVKRDDGTMVKEIKGSAEGVMFTHVDGVDMTHIVGLSTDGVRGLSPIRAARNAIGTALAGDKAAAKLFATGVLVPGVVVPKETLDKDQAEALKASIASKLTGTQNAGSIPLLNASLEWVPFSMSPEDLQFIESRVHQVEEIARLFGVPKIILAEDGASTWGSGISQLLQWMARTTLQGYTTRIEEKLSRLLPPDTRHCEFEYAGLLSGTPAEEIDLLNSQVEAGLLTLNEARAIRNLPPVAGGDLLPWQRVTSTVTTSTSNTPNTPADQAPSGEAA